MATAQCSWRAWITCMPGRRDIASHQYMLASPIRVNSASTPSAWNASASMSETFDFDIVSVPSW
jgi:hypothetical protein